MYSRSVTPNVATTRDIPRTAADTITRAGLLLTATGVLSAAIVRHAIDEGNDIIFAYGFLL